VSTEEAVARYYEANTRRFLRIGATGDAYAIHRLLWGPGVTDAKGAADFIHRILIERILELPGSATPRITDLGCGVGGTLLRLAEAWPNATAHGVTISREQARIAKRLVARRGLSDRVSIERADFLTAAPGSGADVVVAIESFAHAPSRVDAMAAAAAHLLPGGHLLLVDDFLESDEDRLDRRRRALVSDLRAGWRLPGLGTVDSWVEAGRRARLTPVSDDDLTQLTRADRVRDRLLAAAAPALRTLGLVGIPLFGNMIGGNALRVGLQERFLHYRFLTFRRVEASIDP